MVCAAFAPLTVEAAFALPYNVQDFGGNLQDNFKESVAAAVSSDAVRVRPFRVEILNITAAGGARRLLSDSCVVAFSIRVPGADTAKAASIAAALTLADVNTELAAFDERLPVNERGVQAATAVVQQAQVVTPPPVTEVSGSPPSGRFWHAMGSADSCFYVFGKGEGWEEQDDCESASSCGDTGELFRFSTTPALEWERLDATTVGLVSGSRPGYGMGYPGAGWDQQYMVAVGNDLFIFGGRLPSELGADEEGFYHEWSGTLTKRHQLSRFSTTALRWEQLTVSGDLPETDPTCSYEDLDQRRHGHDSEGAAMAAVGEHLFLLVRGCGRPNDLYRISTTALRWELLTVSGSEPILNAVGAMVAAGGYLYVYGHWHSEGIPNVPYCNPDGGWPKGDCDHPLIQGDSFYRISATALKWERLDAPLDIVNPVCLCV